MFGVYIADDPEFESGCHKEYLSESRVNTTSNNRQFNRTARWIDTLDLRAQLPSR